MKESDSKKSQDAMSVAKQQLMEAVAATGGLRSIRLGSTTYIHVGENAADVYADLVKTAIRTGEAIYHADGAREFYEWVPMYDPSKEGTDCYTWHRDRNRAKHELIKTVVRSDGSTLREVIKISWRMLE